MEVIRAVCVDGRGEDGAIKMVEQRSDPNWKKSAGAVSGVEML